MFTSEYYLFANLPCLLLSFFFVSWMKMKVKRIKRKSKMYELKGILCIIDLKHFLDRYSSLDESFLSSLLLSLLQTVQNKNCMFIIVSILLSISSFFLLNKKRKPSFLLVFIHCLYLLSVITLKRVKNEMRIKVFA